MPGIGRPKGGPNRQIDAAGANVVDQGLRAPAPLLLEHAERKWFELDEVVAQDGHIHRFGQEHAFFAAQVLEKRVEVGAVMCQ